MARILVLMTCLCLAACGAGPDTEALKKDVAARLAEAMPAGSVTLEGVHRRGSQGDTKAPSGETRRVVYFDADLKLAKDYDLGAWDSPGVAGVVSALGTGPKGLSGIVSGGNKAGDVIRAHGSAIYKKEEGKWVAVTSGGFRNVAAPDIASGGKRPAPEKLLAAIKGSIDAVPPETSPAAREVITQELESAHAAIRARIARISAGYAIAAGPIGGQYLRYAQAFADEKSRALALVTAGGEENLKLLRGGDAPLAMLQGDSALMAYEGRGPFKDAGPYPTLRAIGALYPEAVHVIVRSDSPAKSFSDLAGKRIGIGVPGAASRTTVLAVLEAHDLGPDKFVAKELALLDALVALRNKEVDAVLQVIGFPADSIRDASAAIPLRLLPLEDRAVKALAARGPAFFPLTLPKATYPGQPSEIRTVATAAILAVSNELTDTEVMAVTRAVYAPGKDLAARGSAQAAQVSPGTARNGLAIPQHIAAAKALDELLAGKK